MPKSIAVILFYVAIWTDGAAFATGQWLLGLLVICGILYLPFATQPSADAPVDLRGDR